MTQRRPRLQWLPPLLVGASAAVAAEVSVAVLLYGGPGFVRSLTAILAVEGVALAAGFWSAPSAGPDLVDRLRARWLVCLFGFLAAAVFGATWTLVPWLGEERWGQGIGLALLAGVPLFATGSVLGGMSAVATSDTGGRLSPPGAAAALGAALGFILTGLLLPRAPMPASLLVACLVMLSLAGLVFGGVLGARVEVEIRARRPGRAGEILVQERRVPIDGVAVLELVEGSVVRRHGPLADDGESPWDSVLVRTLMPAVDADWRVLLVGGGASGAVRTVLREHPRATVDVIERHAAVVELGREYFGTDLTVGNGDRVSVAVGHIEDAIADAPYGYHLVVVDTASLAALGGARGLSNRAMSGLYRLVTRGGVVAWGPVGDAPQGEELPEGWSRRLLKRTGSDAWPESELVVLAARDGVLARLPDLDRFEPVGEGPP